MSKKISNIVFTKNRPLQLDAYLRSLYRHFPAGLIQTYIIYKPELFGDEYEQVFKENPNCEVIRETDFSADFFGVLNRVNTEYILFGVDDVVYFDSVDFEIIDRTFNEFAGEIFGFSLRFGREMVSRADPVSEVCIDEHAIYNIDWTQGKTANTRYPFELCATIYKTELVRKILCGSRTNNSFCENFFAPNSGTVKLLSKVVKRHNLLKKFGYFYNPNTLESWNCRWCRNNAENLPQRLYFQKLCASAIQINMVNTTDRKAFDDSHGLTIEQLSDKYKHCYRFDIDYITKNKPARIHCGNEYFRLKEI